MPKVLENPRQRILEAARDILTERGYQEFNIRDVAKETGVAVGTIYNYFPTKRDLISEIVVQYGEVCLRRIAAIGLEPEDIFYKLEKVFLQIQTFIETFRGIWYRMSEEVHFNRADDKLAKHQEFIGKLHVLVEQILRDEMAKDQRICIPADCSVFANFLLQNFMVMGQMRNMDFKTFELFLRKVMV